MYESALPEETRLRLAEMEPAGLVVGIPSYRNARTVRGVVERSARALDRHYASLRPVIVHADGHSLDDTLSTAAHVPLPHSVRRVATRYQGLPGKGSALRAICEIAVQLQARAVLILEADVLSLEESWIPRLLQPVLGGTVDMVLAAYAHVEPPLPASELIIAPLLSTLFGIPAHYPTAGELALTGGAAAYLVEQDVWETDVARSGVNVWMTVQIALGQGRLGQARLGTKLHRTSDSPTLAEARFLHEIGTLFRMGQRHAPAWRRGTARPVAVQTLGEPERGDGGTKGHPDPEPIWRQVQGLVKQKIVGQWPLIMLPEQLQQVEGLLRERPATFDDRLWARVVYDFLVVYNLGEGDPDKVVTSLYPLYLLRHAALLSEAGAAERPGEAHAQLIGRQQAAFVAEFDYLLERWDRYISPEQAQLLRELGDQ